MKYASLIALIMTFLAFSCSNPLDPALTTSGISAELAQHRAARISEVRYDLFFDIPEAQNDPIPANMTLQFTLSDTRAPLILDFRTDSLQIAGVFKDSEAIDYQVTNDHILIPAEYLQEGQNSFYLEFMAGQQSLNRNEAYLYTLLVPDRASTLFPCFDQPDLKAKFGLSLSIPNHWKAVCNGAELRREARGDKTYIEFAPSRPISTYIFAFAAGELQQSTAERDGRTMHMYYRENDAEKVARNEAAIFDLHAAALNWLEEYTGIPYPFDKFDFALFPTFQYGGMEHPGAIFYREQSLMLDEGATENQYLGRASLIAHETAHMWFGDLVTMEWFNDVWLKEVFANFMAAKIVNPSFPEINHDLRFLLANQPSAYGEDRTEGSHGIQQKLDNLKNAGTVYGRIIYQKAPVVMKQLEAITGEAAFREGLQEYLQKYAYGNAVWDDLVSILDKRTPLDLNNWSEVWVKEPGMPHFATERLSDRELLIRQLKTSPSGKYWQENTRLALFKNGEVTTLPLPLFEAETRVQIPEGFENPDLILVNGAEKSYGYFQFDEASLDFVLQQKPLVADPLLRGALRMTLYEEMLMRNVSPEVLFDYLSTIVAEEDNALLSQQILGYLDDIFWRFLDPETRRQVAPALEALLWEQMQQRDKLNDKVSFYRSYRSLASTPAAAEKLYLIWNGDLKIEGLPLSENDKIAMVAALALRDYPEADQLLAQQLENISNPDRKKQFAFVMPALSADPDTRTAFFESLKDPAMRSNEPWVLQGLGYLHHPLRAESSVRYIRPALDLLEEIQQTGDIFFPKRWLESSFGGHRSPEAAAIIRQFLEENPDYSYRLKNKILQAADPLFRASELKG